jgi:hypothetical protein
LATHLSGRIEHFPVADLLQWLEVQGASGRLTLRRGADRKTIDWKSGDIVYVSGTRPSDRIATALAQTGDVAAEALYAALAKNFGGGPNLSRILLEDGLVTREQLSDIAERVATRMLKEGLTWPEGRFDFDADYRTEDLLHIQLRLRSQVVAFQAAKERDDSERSGSSPLIPVPSVPRGEEWERPFEPEPVEDAFWRARSRSGELPFDLETERRYFLAFRDLAAALRSRLARPVRFSPAFEDTLRNLPHPRPRGRRGAGWARKVEAVIRRDPFFTLDLLQLANSLAGGASAGVATVRSAIKRVGPAAVAAMGSALENEGALAPTSQFARALRRGALAAAFAAAGLAADASIDEEDAFTAGLLHVVPYVDILETLGRQSFPAGPFRAAAIETFRPIVGRIRAAALNLPVPMAEVLSDDGATDPSLLSEIVRRARRAFPTCSLGFLPPGGPRPPGPGAVVGRELGRVFEELGLGTPEAP